MSAAQPTAAADRIPFVLKVVYGLGAFVNNTLAAAIGGMIIVLNLGLGMDPASVGLLGALPRLFDALTDPIMGYVSDHTRSRWGRRRPYIFGGALASGLTFMLLWSMPQGWSETAYFVWFLLGSLAFYAAYTVFATPWVALGYELTPDFHERTRLMGVQNFIGQSAYIVSPWFLWIMNQKAWFADQLTGARALAVIVAVVVMTLGVLPAIFLRERFAAAGPPEPDPKVVGPNPLVEVAEVGRRAEGDPRPPTSLMDSLIDFAKGMKTTLSSGPFLLLGMATFLVFNGFILISSFQSYVIIYYVFGGDVTRGAEYAGYSGSLGAISTFAVIALVTWLATRIGKKNTFYLAMSVSIVGYLLKWVCYTPATPWLLLVPAPFMAFGLGGLFTLMGSMIADVVDEDELHTHERREGMFGSIFWWVVKLGMAAAIAGGGFLLEWTAFDVDLGGAQDPSSLYWMRVCDAFIPAFATLLAIFAVARYPIDEQRAAQTRAVLEARRAGG
jgi:GPH family glycoside/pentoside/hexuronide:cation symporter